MGSLFSGFLKAASIKSGNALNVLISHPHYGIGSITSKLEGT